METRAILDNDAAEVGSSTGDRTEDRRSQEQPLVFISHRHDDKALADVIRQTFLRFSGGSIRIHQSSSAQAEGPQGGRNLTTQLRKLLEEASALILVYTEPAEDWQYCMWECGLATAGAPDTRVVLFECTGQIPKIFEGEVRVNVRDRESVQRFMNEIFTKDQFFPGFGKRTNFKDNGEEVVAAAEELCGQFDKLLFAGEARPPGDWPSAPFIKLSLTFDHLDAIERASEAGSEEARRVTRTTLENEARVVNGDAFAARLLGLAGPESLQGALFGHLVRTWSRRCPNHDLDWVASLSDQVMRAAQDHFPRMVWKMMWSADEDDRGRVYAPALMRAQTRPGRRVKEFGVYFCKFSVNEDRAIEIGAPPAVGVDREG